ncbi:hypothetical protein B0H14DRAFT_2705131, partial [Mycena olivaceomarginata]
MYSPFQDILHTNTIPMDAECDSIHALLRGPRKEVVDLTEEIARLQSLVEKASQKRAKLEEFIDAHLALVSPFRRLPDDIVRAIFLATLPLTRNCTLSHMEGPLLLGRVCRWWRALALTTPRLWASMHIVVPDPSQLELLTQKVAVWLERSGTVPLDISLFYSRMAPSSFDISSMMSPIIAVSRRWRNIQLIPDFLCPDLSPENTPLLQSIAFKNDAESSLKSAMFLATERLRKLECLGAPPIINGPISWRSLNHFTVYSILCDDALRILAQCPALETCQLVLRTAHVMGSPLHPQHIPLPRLHHLSITHARLADSRPFLENLALPALRSYFCSFRGFGPAGITLGALLPATTGHLECLEIQLRRLGSASILAVLADMPSLEELRIGREPRDENRDRDPQFLAHLTPPLGGAGPILCPRLRRLTLKQFKAVSDDTLLDFVRSRTGVRLKALRESTGLDITQLSLFACSLQRSPQRDVRADLRRTGCVTNLTYQQDSAILYSPSEGLDD